MQKQKYNFSLEPNHLFRSTLSMRPSLSSSWAKNDKYGGIQAASLYAEQQSRGKHIKGRLIPPVSPSAAKTETKLQLDCTVRNQWSFHFCCPLKVFECMNLCTREENKKVWQQEVGGSIF